MILLSFLLLFGDIPLCYQRMETQFFNPNVVSQALSLYRYDQSMWNLATRDLTETSRTIPDEVQQRARKMRPNPLKRPFNADATQALIEQLLYERFVLVMAKYSITDPTDLKGMFHYIQQKFPPCTPRLQ